MRDGTLLFPSTIISFSLLRYLPSCDTQSFPGYTHYGPKSETYRRSFTHHSIPCSRSRLHTHEHLRIAFSPDRWEALLRRCTSPLSRKEGRAWATLRLRTFLADLLVKHVDVKKAEGVDWEFHQAWMTTMFSRPIHARLFERSAILPHEFSTTAKAAGVVLSDQITADLYLLFLYHMFVADTDAFHLFASTLYLPLLESSVKEYRRVRPSIIKDNTVAQEPTGLSSSVDQWTRHLYALSSKRDRVLLPPLPSADHGSESTPVPNSGSQQCGYGSEFSSNSEDSSGDSSDPARNDFGASPAIGKSTTNGSATFAQKALTWLLTDNTRDPVNSFRFEDVMRQTDLEFESPIALPETPIALPETPPASPRMLPHVKTGSFMNLRASSLDCRSKSVSIGCSSVNSSGSSSRRPVSVSGRGSVTDAGSISVAGSSGSDSSPGFLARAGSLYTSRSMSATPSSTRTPSKVSAGSLSTSAAPFSASAALPSSPAATLAQVLVSSRQSLRCVSPRPCVSRSSGSTSPTSSVRFAFPSVSSLDSPGLRGLSDTPGRKKSPGRSWHSSVRSSDCPGRASDYPARHGTSTGHSPPARCLESAGRLASTGPFDFAARVSGSSGRFAATGRPADPRHPASRGRSAIASCSASPSAVRYSKSRSRSGSPSRSQSPGRLESSSRDDGAPQRHQASSVGPFDFDTIEPSVMMSGEETVDQVGIDLDRGQDALDRREDSLDRGEDTLDTALVMSASGTVWRAARELGTSDGTHVSPHSVNFALTSKNWIRLCDAPSSPTTMERLKAVAAACIHAYMSALLARYGQVVSGEFAMAWMDTVTSPSFHALIYTRSAIMQPDLAAKSRDLGVQLSEEAMAEAFLLFVYIYSRQSRRRDHHGRSKTQRQSESQHRPAFETLQMSPTFRVFMDTLYLPLLEKALKAYHRAHDSAFKRSTITAAGDWVGTAVMQQVRTMLHILSSRRDRVLAHDSATPKRECSVWVADQDMNLDEEPEGHPAFQSPIPLVIDSRARNKRQRLSGGGYYTSASGSVLGYGSLVVGSSSPASGSGSIGTTGYGRGPS